MNLGIGSAILIGECDDCGEPITGEFDADRHRVDGDPDKYIVTLECVNCHSPHELLIEPEIEGYLIEDSD
jgi:hypothetical protein